MLHLDILFDARNACPAIADVLVPRIERAIACKLNRLMMLPLPVIELYAVDVQAVEIGHLRKNGRRI
jgi:hypothetical protein